MHHDDVLGRLTEGSGPLDAYTAAELKRIAFRGSAERMMTFGTLDLVSGRVTMLVEVKSRFDGDAACRAVAAVSAAIPARSRRCRSTRANLAGCGNYLRAWFAALLPPNTGRIHMGTDATLDAPRYGYLVTALTARPEFVAYGVDDLPALAPLAARHIFGLPLFDLGGPNRGPSETRCAFADQMIFEGFRP